MDVDNIPVGINFEDYLNNQVAQCDAMLSVIGPSWLNAKDETNQRRLDKPDDFVAIEIAAALARSNILVIPVLVDGMHMPKASELPASLKPLALRNAIQIRNTNFGNDTGQLITKLREALALGRPERTQNPGFLAHLVAAFLFNIGIFLLALTPYFSDNNAAGALAAFVVTLAIIMAGVVALFGLFSRGARIFGLVTTIGGLLAIAAVLVSGQFFKVGLFEDSEFQNEINKTGFFFLTSVMYFAFGQYLPDITETPTKATKINKIIRRICNSWWAQGLFFLVMFGGLANSTWTILYRLTDSRATVLAVVGAQLLVAGFCFVRYRKALAAKPEPSS
jgi:hypothetical protein